MVTRKYHVLLILAFKSIAVHISFSTSSFWDISAPCLRQCRTLSNLMCQRIFIPLDPGGE